MSKSKFVLLLVISFFFQAISFGASYTYQYQVVSLSGKLAINTYVTAEEGTAPIIPEQIKSPLAFNFRYYTSDSFNRIGNVYSLKTDATPITTLPPANTQIFVLYAYDPRRIPQGLAEPIDLSGNTTYNLKIAIQTGSDFNTPGEYYLYNRAAELIDRNQPITYWTGNTWQSAEFMDAQYKALSEADGTDKYLTFRWRVEGNDPYEMYLFNEYQSAQNPEGRYLFAAENDNSEAISVRMRSVNSTRNHRFRSFFLDAGYQLIGADNSTYRINNVDYFYRLDGVTTHDDAQTVQCASRFNRGTNSAWSAYNAAVTFEKPTTNANVQVTYHVINRQGREAIAMSVWQAKGSNLKLPSEITSPLVSSTSIQYFPSNKVVKYGNGTFSIPNINEDITNLTQISAELNPPYNIYVLCNYDPEKGLDLNSSLRYYVSVGGQWAETDGARSTTTTASRTDTDDNYVWMLDAGTTIIDPYNVTLRLKPNEGERLTASSYSNSSQTLQFTDNAESQAVNSFIILKGDGGDGKFTLAASTGENITNSPYAYVACDGAGQALKLVRSDACSQFESQVQVVFESAVKYTYKVYDRQGNLALQKTTAAQPGTAPEIPEEIRGAFTREFKYYNPDGTTQMQILPYGGGEVIVKDYTVDAEPAIDLLEGRFYNLTVGGNTAYSNGTSMVLKAAAITDAERGADAYLWSFNGTVVVDEEGEIDPYHVMVTAKDGTQLEGTFVLTEGASGNAYELLKRQDGDEVFNYLSAVSNTSAAVVSTHQMHDAEVELQFSSISDVHLIYRVVSLPDGPAGGTIVLHTDPLTVDGGSKLELPREYRTPMLDLKDYHYYSDQDCTHEIKYAPYVRYASGTTPHNIYVKYDWIPNQVNNLGLVEGALYNITIKDSKGVTYYLYQTQWNGTPNNAYGTLSNIKTALNSTTDIETTDPRLCWKFGLDDPYAITITSASLGDNLYLTTVGGYGNLRFRDETEARKQPFWTYIFSYHPTTDGVVCIMAGNDRFQKVNNQAGYHRRESTTKSRFQYSSNQLSTELIGHNFENITSVTPTFFLDTHVSNTRLEVTTSAPAGSEIIVPDKMKRKYCDYKFYSNYFMRDGNLQYVEKEDNWVEIKSYPYITEDLPEGKEFRIRVEYTVDENELPFEFSEDFMHARWYWMNVDAGTWVYYHNSYNGLYNGNTNNVSDLSYQFAVFGDPFEVKVMNRAVGDGRYLGVPDETPNVKIQPLTDGMIVWELFDDGYTNNKSFSLRPYGSYDAPTKTYWIHSGPWPVKYNSGGNANQRQIQLEPLLQGYVTYNIVDLDGHIAIKYTELQDWTTPLFFDNIPKAIRNSYIKDETLTFYSNATEAGFVNGRQTYTLNDNDIITATLPQNQSQVYVKYTSTKENYLDKPMRLLGQRSYNLRINGAYYLYVNGTEPQVISDLTDEQKQNPNFLWRVYSDEVGDESGDNVDSSTAHKFDPYAVKVQSMNSDKHFLALTGNTGLNLSLDMSADAGPKAYFILMHHEGSGYYELMVASGSDAADTYYTIGYAEGSDKGLRAYNNGIYPSGKNEVQLLFTSLSSRATYHIIDKQNRIIISETNENPELQVPEKWQSPLVRRYHFYKKSSFYLDDMGTTDDPDDDQYTLLPNENEVTSLVEAREQVAGADTPDTSDDVFQINIYVTYDVDDKVDIRYDARNYTIDQKVMYRLKFHNGRDYVQEDGADGFLPSPTKAFYPYSNGDAQFYIYGDTQLNKQLANASTTRTRWPWYLCSPYDAVNAPNGDPYHVKIMSRQSQTPTLLNNFTSGGNTVSRFNGGRNYFCTYKPKTDAAGTTDYSHVVTGLIVDNDSVDYRNATHGLEPTEYMILGESGNFRLVTTYKVDGEHRTVDSFEQYWKNYPTALKKITGEVVNETLSATQRTALENAGWHSYYAWVNAAPWVKRTDGSTAKRFSNDEHWYQTFSMGDVFDLEEMEIDPVMVLLDMHGWEIMRKPIPNSDTEDPAVKAAKYAQIKPYDSPMVKAYHFYVNAAKISGYHKFKLDDATLITVNGETFESTTLTNLPPYKGVDMVQDGNKMRYQNLDASGRTMDYYVTYTVKEEYANTYAGAAKPDEVKPAAFLVHQGGEKTFIQANSETTVSHTSTEVWEHFEQGTADGVTDAMLWYMKPNFHIDREMGYIYKGEEGALEDAESKYDTADDENGKIDGMEATYLKNGNNGFDPYNIQFQNKQYGSYLSTDATDSDLDNRGGYQSTYPGTHGGLLLKNLEMETAGFGYKGVFQTESYDHAMMNVTNTTFMMVQDENGNMRLMPRFDHHNVATDLVMLESRLASQPANDLMGSQTVVLKRPVGYTYIIVDNKGREALRYTGPIGEVYPAIPAHLRSPMATNFKYYHDFTLTNQDDQYDDAANPYDLSNISDRQIKSSFAEAGVLDTGKNIFVRYEFDPTGGFNALVGEGDWHTVFINGTDNNNTEAQQLKYDYDAGQGIVSGTPSTMAAENPTTTQFDARNNLDFQWKFVYAPYGDCLDPYAVQIFNRAHPTKALSAASYNDEAFKINEDQGSYDRFCFLNHSNNLALAVAGVGSTDNYYFITASDNLNTVYPLKAAREPGFNSFGGSFEGFESMLTFGDVTHDIQYYVITNKGKLALKANEPATRQKTDPLYPVALLPKWARSPILNVSDFIYYQNASYDDATGTYTIDEQSQTELLTGLPEDIVYVRYKYDKKTSPFLVKDKANSVNEDVLWEPIDLSGGTWYNIWQHRYATYYQVLYWKAESASTFLTGSGESGDNQTQLKSQKDYLFRFEGEDPYAITLVNSLVGEDYHVVVQALPEHNGTGHTVRLGFGDEDSNAAVQSFMLLQIKNATGRNGCVFVPTGDIRYVVFRNWGKGDPYLQGFAEESSGGYVDPDADDPFVTYKWSGGTTEELSFFKAPTIRNYTFHAMRCNPDGTLHDSNNMTAGQEGTWVKMVERNWLTPIRIENDIVRLFCQYEKAETTNVFVAVGEADGGRFYRTANMTDGEEDVIEEGNYLNRYPFIDEDETYHIYFKYVAEENPTVTLEFRNSDGTVTPKAVPFFSKKSDIIGDINSDSRKLPADPENPMEDDLKANWFFLEINQYDPGTAGTGGKYFLWHKHKYYTDEFAEEYEDSDDKAPDELSYCSTPILTSEWYEEENGIRNYQYMAETYRESDRQYYAYNYVTDEAIKGKWLWQENRWLFAFVSETNDPYNVKVVNKQASTVYDYHATDETITVDGKEQPFKVVEEYPQTASDGSQLRYVTAEHSDPSIIGKTTYYSNGTSVSRKGNSFTTQLCTTGDEHTDSLQVWGLMMNNAGHLALSLNHGNTGEIYWAFNSTSNNGSNGGTNYTLSASNYNMDQALNAINLYAYDPLVWVNLTMKVRTLENGAQFNEDGTVSNVRRDGEGNVEFPKVKTYTDHYLSVGDGVYHPEIFEHEWGAEMTYTGKDDRLFRKGSKVTVDEIPYSLRRKFCTYTLCTDTSYLTPVTETDTAGNLVYTVIGNEMDETLPIRYQVTDMGKKYFVADKNEVDASKNKNCWFMTFPNGSNKDVDGVHGMHAYFDPDGLYRDAAGNVIGDGINMEFQTVDNRMATTPDRLKWFLLGDPYRLQVYNTNPEAADKNLGRHSVYETNFTFIYDQVHFMPDNSNEVDDSPAISWASNNYSAADAHKLGVHYNGETPNPYQGWLKHPEQFWEMVDCRNEGMTDAEHEEAFALRFKAFVPKGEEDEGVYYYLHYGHWSDVYAKNDETGRAQYKINLSFNDDNALETSGEYKGWHTANNAQTAIRFIQPAKIYGTVYKDLGNNSLSEQPVAEVDFSEYFGVGETLTDYPHHLRRKFCDYELLNESGGGAKDGKKDTYYKGKTHLTKKPTDQLHSNGKFKFNLVSDGMIAQHTHTASTVTNTNETDTHTYEMLPAVDPVYYLYAAYKVTDDAPFTTEAMDELSIYNSTPVWYNMGINNTCLHYALNNKVVETADEYEHVSKDYLDGAWTLTHSYSVQGTIPSVKGYHWAFFGDPYNFKVLNRRIYEYGQYFTGASPVKGLLCVNSDNPEELKLALSNYNVETKPELLNNSWSFQINRLDDNFLLRYCEPKEYDEAKSTYDTTEDTYRYASGLVLKWREFKDAYTNGNNNNISNVTLRSVTSADNDAFDAWIKVYSQETGELMHETTSIELPRKAGEPVDMLPVNVKRYGCEYKLFYHDTQVSADSKNLVATGTELVTDDFIRQDDRLYYIPERDTIYVTYTYDQEKGVDGFFNSFAELMAAKEAGDAEAGQNLIWTNLYFEWKKNMSGTYIVWEEDKSGGPIDWVIVYGAEGLIDKMVPVYPLKPIEKQFEGDVITNQGWVNALDADQNGYANEYQQTDANNQKWALIGDPYRFSMQGILKWMNDNNSYLNAEGNSIGFGTNTGIGDDQPSHWTIRVDNNGNPYLALLDENADKVGTIQGYVSFDREGNGGDKIREEQYLKLVGSEVIDPTGSAQNQGGAKPFYISGLSKYASAVVYHLVIGHVGEKVRLWNGNYYPHDSFSMTNGEIHQTADGKQYTYADMEGTTLRNTHLSTDNPDNYPFVILDYEQQNIGVNNSLSVPWFMKRQHCTYTLYQNHVEQIVNTGEDEEPSTAEPFTIVDGFTYDAEGYLVDPITHLKLDPSNLDENGNPKVLQKKVWQRVPDAGDGLQIKTIGQNHVFRRVYVDVVYHYDDEWFADKGTNTSKWSKLHTLEGHETPADDTSERVHFSFINGVNLSTDPHHRHHTNDYLWTAEGDPYGFVLHNRYVTKNGQMWRRVLSTSDLQDDTRANMYCFNVDAAYNYGQNRKGFEYEVLAADNPYRPGVETGKVQQTDAVGQNSVYEMLQGNLTNAFMMHPVQAGWQVSNSNYITISTTYQNPYLIKQNFLDTKVLERVDASPTADDIFVNGQMKLTTAEVQARRNETRLNWAFEITPYQLLPYFDRSGYVGGLKPELARQYANYGTALRTGRNNNKQVDRQLLINVRNLVYDDNNIVRLAELSEGTEGNGAYFRIQALSQEHLGEVEKQKYEELPVADRAKFKPVAVSGTDENPVYGPRYISGYHNLSEVYATDGYGGNTHQGLNLHFYETNEDNHNIHSFNQLIPTDGEKTTYTATPANRGDIEITPVEFGPASIFFFKNSGEQFPYNDPAFKQYYYFIETQGLQLNNSYLSLPGETDDITHACRVMDLGAATVAIRQRRTNPTQITETSTAAEIEQSHNELMEMIKGDYLAIDNNKRYTVNFAKNNELEERENRVQTTKWCLQPVGDREDDFYHEMPLYLEVHKGNKVNNASYFATFVAPFDTELSSTVNVAFVGDSRTDVGGVHNLLLKSVGVYTGLGNGQQIPAATPVVIRANPSTVRTIKDPSNPMADIHYVRLKLPNKKPGTFPSLEGKNNLLTGVYLEQKLDWDYRTGSRLSSLTSLPAGAANETYLQSSQFRTTARGLTPADNTKQVYVFGVPHNRKVDVAADGAVSFEGTGLTNADDNNDQEYGDQRGEKLEQNDGDVTHQVGFYTCTNSLKEQTETKGTWPLNNYYVYFNKIYLIDRKNLDEAGVKSREPFIRIIFDEEMADEPADYPVDSADPSGLTDEILEKCDGRLYDIAGRLIATGIHSFEQIKEQNLPAGVYVVAGRKFHTK